MIAVLAISAAFFYGLSMVLVRVGLSSSNTLTGILISLVSPLVVLVGICLFTVSLDQFATGAVLFFILAGISGPFIARVLFFAGINRVGSAIASSLYGTKTMFAAIAAVVNIEVAWDYPDPHALIVHYKKPVEGDVPN